MKLRTTTDTTGIGIDTIGRNVIGMDAIGMHMIAEPVIHSGSRPACCAPWRPPPYSLQVMS